MADRPVRPRRASTLVDLLDALEPLPTPSPPQPPPSEKLARFGLLGELGRGGMGRVLLARDPDIGREVAIKVVVDPLTVSPEQLRRFVAEAQITGQLEHPNIVPVYELGLTDDGRVYFVLKRVQGETLATLTPGAGEVPPLTRRVAVFEQVCNAVAYAHHRGVVHRDLKPDNVMVGAFGEVLVLDWGLARLIGTTESTPLTLPDEALHTQQGLVMGTPGFIAPELLARGSIGADARSDQWALGAILYELLCGQSAVPGRSTAERLMATRAPIEDVCLRDLDADVPDAIGEVCMRALAFDPADRFDDVAALAAATRGFLDGADRRRRALAVVAEADALRPRIDAAGVEEAALREEADRRIASVRPSDPVESKTAAWELEAEADALASAARLDATIWLQTLRSALNLVPDLPEAHRRLAQHYRGELEAAEARRDRQAIARSEWLLRQHDRGLHRRYLDGHATLSLVTDPPGAEVQLHRYVERHRRLQLEDRGVLGRTPLQAVALEPGSYLCILRAEGRAPVRYPVALDRAGSWTGTPPDATSPAPIRLPSPAEVGPDDVVVPAGWFVAGGDPHAAESFDRRRVWVDGFITRRFPVTTGEYLDWLNRLVDAGEAELAARYLPRDRKRPTHPLDGEPLLGWDGARYVPPEGADARFRDLPITRVDQASARAFAAAAPSTGAPWRLPQELEWEKAARGVDGRTYPWGDQLDPAFACMSDSQELPQPVPVDAFELDASPYGVRGLGGNVRDWCDDGWTAEGAAADGERLGPPDRTPGALQCLRGGAYNNVARLCRSAIRFADPATVRFAPAGFRLVRSL